MLLANLPAHAQSGVLQTPGCPPGVAPGQPGCGGSSLNRAQPHAYSGPLWQDRYGAIAVDATTGSIGWAAGSRSKLEAANAALVDCGCGGCKIRAQVRNSCVAVAWGGGLSGFAAAPDLRKAEGMAVRNCSHGNVGG